jgi:hypothetical protein
MPWNDKLSRPLALKDGKRLLTLKDARSVLLDYFANVIHSEPLAYAGGLLIKAAETGDRADIEAATDQIERALASYRILR